MNWSVHRVRAGAAEVHARDFDGPRGVYVIEPPGESIVLGSRQTMGVLDLAACADRHVHVVTRRSGGGIVHLVEDGFVWVDIVIDRGDPLWTDDVRASMRWLGDAWSSALTALGVADCRVHDGALTGGALGDLVCFAGVGPGEVVTGTGAKLVGISQRRSRERARFQCTVLRRWEPEALVGLLADKQVDIAELARRVQPIGAAPDVLVDALLRSLP